MGCSGCSSAGSCGSGGACGTCHSKLPVFNWLSEVHDPKQDIVEVTFKNGRKGFYRNQDKLQLRASDVVTVEGSPGYDIGIVSMAGALIRLQLRKKGVEKDSDEIKKIYRKSNQADLDKWQLARGREKDTMYRTRIMASDIGLKMKITDVEFQGDNGKATFFYTAEDRVDFRELIKVMAQEFKIRIEMRQIGARQESARLGGIGSCGRELCCSTWLTDFRSVNTSAARYQQLSLNPQKLAGQCGKLKCCLNYELDSYVDALKDFPPQTALKLKSGRAQFQKMDIFGGKILYSIQEEFKMSWVELTLDKVREVQALNADNIYPESLDEYAIIKEEEAKVDFENVVGQDSLTRFDASRGRRNRKPKAKVRNRENTSVTANKRSNVKRNDSDSENINSSKREPRNPRNRKNNRSRGERVIAKNKPNSNKNTPEKSQDSSNFRPKKSSPQSREEKQKAMRQKNIGNPGRKRKSIPKPSDGGMEAFVAQQKKANKGNDATPKKPNPRRKQNPRRKNNPNKDKGTNDQ